MKRVFDILFAGTILIVLLPLLMLIAVGVRLSSPGPVIYVARRIGRDGEEFKMLKFRSMHINRGGSVITSQHDSRIFPFGDLIRKLKIDEFPQFVNVLKGDMSIVGPRPEDPKMVHNHYADWMMETFSVRPGITSPGAIYYYALGGNLVDSENPEASYVENLLPPKLAVDRAYLERATFLRELFLIFHTAIAVIGVAIGRPVGPSQKDLDAALQWVPTTAFEGAK